MKISLKAILAVAALIVFADGSSCAARISEAAGATVAPTEVKPVSRVTVELTPTARDELGGTSRFDVKALRASVEEALKSGGLFHPELGRDATVLEIVVTRVEFPSKFNAIALGPFAGKNPIEGYVSVLGAHGKTVNKVHVKTSHPLGYFAHVQDEKHFERLYDAFAVEMIKQLKGEKPHRAPVWRIFSRARG